MTEDSIRDALAFYGITRSNWLGVGIETFKIGEEPRPYSAEVVLRFVNDGRTVTAREGVDGWYRSDFSAERAAEREADRWWRAVVALPAPPVEAP